MGWGFCGGKIRRGCGVFAVVVLGLAGCSDKQTVLFDGQVFKASADAARSDRSNFTVTVRDAAGNLDAAQRAGRYEGVVYCSRTYGSSQIEWAAPLVDPAQQVPDAAGALVLQGRCAFR